MLQVLVLEEIINFENIVQILSVRLYVLEKCWANCKKKNIEGHENLCISVENSLDR